MLYRAATFAIVAFWLVMMGLLVRLETRPEATDILDVPVSYVIRIMFKNSQEAQSLLAVTDGAKSIGTISLRPMTTGSEARTLDFSGTLSIPQRFNFSGAIDMDAALKIRDFHLDASIRKPQYTLKASGDTALGRLSYEVRVDGVLTATQTLPMDPAALVPALAQNLGLNPHALPIAPSGVSTPAITAREAQITLRGEQLQVYEVAVSEGTVPIITFYITQMGQIILAKTNFGYTLSAEDWQ
jgi:hypothetical protein